ncbi:MAG: sialidase family protein, partial [Bacteroidota bacterium]
MAVDRTNGPSRDNLYMAYFEFQVSPDTLASIRCFSKRRTQANFVGSSVQVNTLPFVDLQFTSMSVDQVGDLHISFWGSLDNENYTLYHARSDDEGASFYPETKIAEIAFPPIDSTTGFPASNIVGVTRLYPCPHLAADASNGPFAGNLYAIWTARGVDSMLTEGFDIYFSRSTDGGQNWEVPRILNDDADPETHQFFSSLYVNEQGVLIASWYDRRADPANVETDYYWTYSMDGGQTFASQNAITSQRSDFAQIGSQNGGFGVGEYTQVIATDGYAIPVWADGRSNDGSVSIYAAWAPLSGPATALERSVRLQAKLQMISWYQEQNQVQISW